MVLYDVLGDVDCGIMLGSPGQTREYILEDIRYMQQLQPHMIGIGPFIPHKDTPFREEMGGTLTDTRRKYLLYEGKAGCDCRAGEAWEDMEEWMGKIGYHVTVARGDYPFKKTF